MEVTLVDIDESVEIKVTPKDTNQTIGTEVTSKDVEKADGFQVTSNDVDLAGRTLVTSTDLMYYLFKSPNSRLEDHFELPYTGCSHAVRMMELIAVTNHMTSASTMPTTRSKRSATEATQLGRRCSRYFRMSSTASRKGNAHFCVCWILRPYLPPSTTRSSSDGWL